MSALTGNQRFLALAVYRTIEVQIFSDFQHVYKIIQHVYRIPLKTAVSKTGFFSPLQLHNPFLHPSTFLRILVTTQTSPVKGGGVGGLGGQGRGDDAAPERQFPPSLVL